MNNPYAYGYVYPQGVSPYAMMSFPQGGAYPGAYAAWAGMPPVAATPARANASSMPGSSFVKGALVGALAAYVLSNEHVQETMIHTAVKSWSVLQGGIEELKERFRDAEAELHAAQMHED
ncbi:MAG: hypothetical protein ACOC00_07160 [Halothiobacillaceae bacterium]